MEVRISLVQDYSNIVEESYIKEFKNDDELNQYLDDNCGHPWLHIDWEILEEHEH